MTILLLTLPMKKEGLICLLVLADHKLLSFINAALDVHFNPILPTKEMLSGQKTRIFLELLTPRKLQVGH